MAGPSSKRAGGLFSWAVKTKRMAENQARDITLGKESPKERRILENAEVMQLLKAAGRARWLAASCR